MAGTNNGVTKLLGGQNHPLRKEIEKLRQHILRVQPELTENWKWNGPNYCFDNNDCITMRIQPAKQLQLIFHRGAKVKEPPKEKLIKDDFVILTWKGNDRAIVTFKNMHHIETSKMDLTKTVKEWINATK